MRLSPGARVGPYEIIAPLGSGGMGEVYRARDTRLAREVALKIVTGATKLDAEWIQRFEQEAKLAGSLSHPNLVVVHDVGTEDGAPFLVTELLQGESLRERLRHGRIPLRTVLEIATQVAEGLAAAHVRGIVHRDIKPENIFVTSEGRAKVLDFGIAKLTKPRPVEGTRNLLDTTLTPDTRPGTVIGTPGYMSPEQVAGRPRRRPDRHLQSRGGPPRDAREVPGPSRDRASSRAGTPSSNPSPLRCPTRYRRGSTASSVAAWRRNLGGDSSPPRTSPLLWLLRRSRRPEPHGRSSRQARAPDGRVSGCSLAPWRF